MTEMTLVYETTGAVSISVDDSYVVIEQQSTVGDAPEAVSIPRPLFREVLNSIFAELEAYELRDIAELAEVHAKPAKREG